MYILLHRLKLYPYSVRYTLYCVIARVYPEYPK